MFLNKTKFKKAMKETYNRPGLKAGRIYGGLVLCSGTWVLWVKEGAEPELAEGYTDGTGGGAAPEEESMFLAAHNEAIQYEIKENSIYNLPGEFCNSHYAFKDTGITMDGRRFLQGKENRADGDRSGNVHGYDRFSGTAGGKPAHRTGEPEPKRGFSDL